MSSPTAIVDTDLLGFASSCVTNIRLVYGERQDTPQQTGSVSERLSALRRLYEVGNFENRVADGGVQFGPFPENEQYVTEYRWNLGRLLVVVSFS